MAEDIDFKFPMKLACSSEVSQFCADVPHGHAHVIRCLQEHTDDGLMGAGCRQVVADDAVRSSTDHRCAVNCVKAHNNGQNLYFSPAYQHEARIESPPPLYFAPLNDRMPEQLATPFLD